MMSIVDSISSIAMDAPMVVIVLEDVEEEFVFTKSDMKIIVESNQIEFKFSYAANF
jgi:hypothetical protein